MRVWHLSTVFALVVGVAACGGNSSTATNPTATPTVTAPTPISATGTSTVTGTWVGTAADSSGVTMGMSTGSMGMGTPGGSMGNMAWQMTQTGDRFTGTVSSSGYRGTSPMRVAGLMNGKSGTFTMTLPNGTMPMAGCSGQVTGTFDMDEMLALMHGAYTGSTTCFGSFDRGLMTMTRQ